MKKFTKKQYIRFGVAAVLYGLFILWMQSAWLLLGYILLVDIFLTKYIHWGAWKNVKNPRLRNVLEWVDDIIFALIAVYFINVFIFQNYQIPSSSLEKSLLVGDYLFVSKLSYGPLPVCEQIELRAACTEHAHCLPVGAEHVAHRELQVLSGLARRGLQAGERARTGETGRHRGV